MVRAWIFQCVPKNFGVDGFLTQCSGTLTWSVKQSKSDIAIGDTVYLWRSGEQAGIVAEAEIIGPVEERAAEPEAIPFWSNPNDAAAVIPRVRMKLRRVAKTREVIQRKWLEEDHVLKNLLIIRRPSGTNFRVAPELAPRLAAIWANTGRNWSYAEVVAAMWAYAEVYGQPVSKGEGSAVDQVSRLINRVITGVYNKIMNLRALDPRVDAKGFASGSKVDKQVWGEFFDPVSATIRTEELHKRFSELWQDSATTQPTPEDVAVRDGFDDEVQRLDETLAERSFAELMTLYTARGTNKRPRRRPTRSNLFDRDPLVVLITKRRADYKCEVSSCAAPVFFAANSRPYVETHHLVPLAEGGDDHIANTACLCAIHHREVHCGKSRGILTEKLRALRTS